MSGPNKNPAGTTLLAPPSPTRFRRRMSLSCVVAGIILIAVIAAPETALADIQVCTATTAFRSGAGGDPLVGRCSGNASGLADRVIDASSGRDQVKGCIGGNLKECIFAAYWGITGYDVLGALAGGEDTEQQFLGLQLSSDPKSIPDAVVVDYVARSNDCSFVFYQKSPPKWRRLSPSEHDPIVFGVITAATVVQPELIGDSAADPVAVWQGLQNKQSKAVDSRYIIDMNKVQPGFYHFGFYMIENCFADFQILHDLVVAIPPAVCWKRNMVVGTDGTCEACPAGTIAKMIKGVNGIEQMQCARSYSAWAGAFAPYPETIRTGDINGDGIQDVCGRASQGVGCWVSKGQGPSTLIAGPALSDAAGFADAKYETTLVLADVNADQRADLCIRTSWGFPCWLADGSGFPTMIQGPDLTDVAGWGDPQYSSTTRLGDVNGDGRADVCAQAGLGFPCWLSSGAGFPTLIVAPSSG